MNKHKKKPIIGIALGGGGVRGLAHLPILSVFDELGIKPDYISGTSMGGLVGTIYASGIDAKKIINGFREHILLKNDTFESFMEKRENLVNWFKAFKLAPRSGGVLKTDGLIEYILQKINVKTFDDLQIPLTMIATDYWDYCEVQLQSGELKKAVQATIAIPGVFSPIVYNDKVLVDGGIVNQVPYEQLMDTCDIVIAVDVTGKKSPKNLLDTPKPMESILTAFEILQITQLKDRIKQKMPTILLTPPIQDVDVLEFNKFEEVITAGEASAYEFKEQLTNLLKKYERGHSVIGDFFHIG